MEIRTVFIGLRIAVSLLELMSVVLLCGSLDALKQGIEPIDALSVAGDTIEDSSMKCILQSTPFLSEFSMDGDFVIGGVFSLHYQLFTVTNDYTAKPKPLRCTRRSVKRQSFCKRSLTYSNSMEITICCKMYSDEGKSELFILKCILIFFY